MPQTRYPLGRIKQHDPRSAAYSIGPRPKALLAPADWKRRAPIFDQGNLGSCTGNAGAGLVCTDTRTRSGYTSVVVSGNVLPVDETLAIQVYSLATQLDEYAGTYPPDDTGSSGLGAAKALVRLGLASAYRHAFSIAALQSALQDGAVMAGIKWLESMFTVDGEGYVTVDRRSSVAGGHEFVISAWDPSGKRYRMDNSWNTDWGINGSAWFHEADLKWLLSDDGDVTQPVFPAAPAPPPAPTGLTDEELWHAAQNWAAGKGFITVG